MSSSDKIIALVFAILFVASAVHTWNKQASQNEVWAQLTDQGHIRHVFEDCDSDELKVSYKGGAYCIDSMALYEATR